MAKFLAKTVSNENTEEAIRELRNKFSGFPVGTLLFFASYKHDSARVAALMKEAFPEALTFGCSSYAEMGEGRVLYGGIAAMAFSPDALESLYIAPVENLTSDPGAVDRAFAELERQNGCCRAMQFDYHDAFGMILFDGRTAKIEQLLGRIGNLTDVIFVGGYASDDFSLTNIHVYYDGKSYEDAALLAVLKPTMPFHLLKTQSAAPAGPTFIAGGVVDDGLTIREFNGRPAAEAFAEAVATPADKLTADIFTVYSFGLMADGEPFIRAGRCFNEDGSIGLFGRVGEGQRLQLMKTGDVVSATAGALARTREKLGSISAIVDFDCAHRDLILAEQKSTRQYAALFEGIETIALATFCEVYIANINQSSVMAAFA